MESCNIYGADLVLEGLCKISASVDACFFHEVELPASPLETILTTCLLRPFLARLSRSFASVDSAKSSHEMPELLRRVQGRDE